MFNCSTTSNFNNWNLKTASKTKRRNKTDVQNLEITLRIPPKPHCFRHYATFFETFWIAPKGSPSVVSTFCNTMDVKKSQRVLLLHFSAHVTLFKHLIFKFFCEIFQVPKGSPSIFFIFCNQLEFHKSRRVPPFTFLSLRYSANFFVNGMHHELLLVTFSNSHQLHLFMLILQLKKLGILNILEEPIQKVIDQNLV